MSEGIDTADLDASVEAWALTFVEPGGPAPDRLPPSWRPVLDAVDSGTRRDAALALWNPDLLALIPQFADALRHHFLDVRVGVTDEGIPALAYVAPGLSPGEFHVWVGYAPEAFGEPPPFWSSFAPPLQTFLRTVHAGFTCETRTSFGPCRPAYMETVADQAGFPEGIPGWEDDVDIPSTRLLIVTEDGGILRYCVSPDLGPTRLALVEPGEAEPVDLGPALDKLLMWRLEN
jgi:hypothetical protein